MKMKRNQKGFTLVEVLLVVIVLTAVAGLSVVGYKQLKKNDTAGATSYSFIHHTNQMAPVPAGKLPTETYGGITYAKAVANKPGVYSYVATFASATELVGATKVCAHYRAFTTTSIGTVAINVKNVTTGQKNESSAPIASAGLTKNICTNLSQRGTSVIQVWISRSAGTDHIGIDTIYGLR